MALLQEWQKIAYDEKADKGLLRKFWTDYFALEKSIYEKLLENPDQVEKGTVKDTVVNLGFDKELLYKNMVDAKADWLYELPQWESIFSAEKREELYKEQKRANTIVKGKKIGRNDPCPCGSGKKYKFCCGRN